MSYLCPNYRVSVLTRNRYDLNPTFEVLVGSKTFLLHTNVFTERSEFFRAARKPEWLGANPKKPVDLKDEDPKVFNEYMNCVYFGQDALKHHADDFNSCSSADRNSEAIVVFGLLIQVYLLADKLEDTATANLAVDEIMQLSDSLRMLPGNGNYAYVYGHTAPHSPLRKLMRDYWLYETGTTTNSPVNGLPEEFMKDVMLEFLRIKGKREGCTVRDAFKRTLSEDLRKDKCRYHQHDEKHPRCVSEPKSD
jgi:hypothetical protein